MFNKSAFKKITQEHTYDEAYPVYPGEYHPNPSMKEWFGHEAAPGQETAPLSPVNLNEYNDCFRLEAAIPGVKRECIFIKVHDHVLSIFTISKAQEGEEKERARIHEFDCHMLERNVNLPRNADTEFLVAEYRQGILYIHLPKTEEPVVAVTKYVVVY